LTSSTAENDVDKPPSVAAGWFDDAIDITCSWTIIGYLPSLSIAGSFVVKQFQYNNPYHMAKQVFYV
jgi:hypothetical protein